MFKIKDKYLAALVYFIIDTKAKQIVRNTEGQNIMREKNCLSQKSEVILDILFFCITNPNH